MNRLIVLALLSIYLLWLANGCERSTTAPDEIKLEVHLGQGWSSAEWWLVGNTCPGESYCFSRLRAASSLSGPATIIATVKGNLGTIEQSTEMTSTDYTAFFELVERAVLDAIRNRSNAYVGCDTSIGYSEIIGFFAGDTGYYAHIEGCDDQDVVEIRKQVLELAAKYFPSAVNK